MLLLVEGDHDIRIPINAALQHVQDVRLHVFTLPVHPRVLLDHKTHAHKDRVRRAVEVPRARGTEP